VKAKGKGQKAKINNRPESATDRFRGGSARAGKDANSAKEKNRPQVNADKNRFENKGRGTKDEAQISNFKSQTRDRKAGFAAETEDRKPKIRDRRPKTEDRFSNDSEQAGFAASTNTIFGVLPVLESLRAGSRKIEKIFVAEGAHEKRLQEIFELLRRGGIPFQKVPRQNLQKFVEPGANHQGIVALVASGEYVAADELIEEIAAKDDSLCVILDGVEDPRNLGAILRTIECAGAGGVFIPERRAVGLTETVAKSSAGATEYVKVAKVGNINRLIEGLKANNIWVVGASGEAKIDYTEWDWTRNCALVLGGEGKGLHRLTAEKCDVLVKIPLLGRIESLNVSVAAGVILYEAVRQRSLRHEDAETRGDEAKEATDEGQRTKD
jgi:23S rRNA (guanosine2251-2'-O)-methyltransferase